MAVTEVSSTNSAVQAKPDPIKVRFDEVIARGREIPIQGFSKTEVAWIDQEYVTQRWEEVTDVDAFTRWRVACVSLVHDVVPDASPHRKLVSAFSKAKADPEVVRSMVAHLTALRDEHMAGRLVAQQGTRSREEVLVVLRTLCRRFHAVARQLLQRHDDRSTLEISDEYDVQDLMHALLQVHFDDVLAEDHASTQAGATSRPDFVLGGLGVLLELKKTRKGLGTNKQVGDELIVDIERYRSHPECSTILFFVYDPEHRLANPVALEKSLTRDHDGVSVEALVFPKVSV